MKKVEVGEIVTRKCRNRISRYQKQPDGSFKYVPNGLGKGGDRKSARAKAEIAVKRSNETAERGIIEGRASVASANGIVTKTPKQRFIPNTERPPIEKKLICRTDKNPDQFTVKCNAGKLVPVSGYPVKTWKYQSA